MTEKKKTFFIAFLSFWKIRISLQFLLLINLNKKRWIKIFQYNYKLLN